MTKDEALELALEALEEVVKWYQARDKDDKPMPPHNQNPEIKQAIETITAMKELLAQPKEPDPVAWLQIGLAPLHEGDVIARTTKPTKWNPEWWRFEPLYTTPPHRPWVGLTEEEIEKGRAHTFSINNPYCPCDSKTMRKAVRWAEAKLKNKNTRGQE